MNGATQSWKQSFIYDRYGNHTFDAANTTIPAPLTNLVINPSNNRFDSTAAGQSLISYDNAGNLTREVGGNTYGYDGDNRMTGYNGGNPATGGASYAYDGDGLRVKKVTSESTTIFVYNVVGQLVAEYTNLVPDPSTWAGVSYLTADHLGTPRVITKADGTVKSRHDYLPFGEELSAGTGGRTTTQGYNNNDGIRHKFTQKERDNETGLDYFGARYYASAQGRFTSPDPLLGSASVFAPQSWNRYVYTLNNPLKYVDPTGMNPTDPTYHWITDGLGNYMSLNEQQWQDFLNDKEGDLYGGFYPVDTGTYIGSLRFVTGSDEFLGANSGLIGSAITLGADGNFHAVDTTSVQPGPGDTTGALQLLFEYLTGRGPADREFGPSDFMTQGMMTSPDVAAARQKFIEQGGGTYTGGVRFGLGAEDGPFEAGLNMPRQFVGSFTITITEHKDGDAHFVLENATTLKSALYQCPGVQPVERTTMLPLSNKTQTFWWIERGLIKR